MHLSKHQGSSLAGVLLALSMAPPLGRASPVEQRVQKAQFRFGNEFPVEELALQGCGFVPSWISGNSRVVEFCKACLDPAQDAVTHVNTALVTLAPTM